MPVRGDEIETVLTVNDREYKRVFRDAAQTRDRFVADSNRAFNSMGSGRGGGFGFGIVGQGLKMLPGLGQLAGVLGDVAGKMQDGVGWAFEYNRALQENSLSFTVMLKSGEKAKALIADLLTLRADGMAFPEAALGAKRLLAAGFAAKEIVPFIRAIGNASKISGADVDSVSRAISQMASKGAASSEEISQQIAEQGINAWRYVADAIAKERPDFAKLAADQQISMARKLVEQGKISGKGAAQAIGIGMQNEFKEGGKRFATETVTGLENAIAAQAQRLAGTAAGPLFEAYQNLLRRTHGIVHSQGAEVGAAGAGAYMGGGLDAMRTALKEGQNIAGGFLEGAKGAGVGLASKLLYEFGSSDGIDSHSPAKKFIPLGFSAGEGFMIGFEDGVRAGGGIMGVFQSKGGRRLGGNPERERIIEEAAAKQRLDPNLIRAMMRQESGGKRYAKSHKGASGLMQLMPDTARGLGVTDIYDEIQNIHAGAKYLRQQLDRFGGNVDLALAAYNAGPGAVIKYGGIPPYRETQGYVKSIKAHYGQMSGGGFMQSGTAAPLPVTITNIPATVGKTNLTPEQVLGRDWFGGFKGAGWKPGQTNSFESDTPAGRDLQGGTGGFASGVNQRGFLEWLYFVQKATPTRERTSVAEQSDWNHKLKLMAEEMQVTEGFVREAHKYVLERLALEKQARDLIAARMAANGGFMPRETNGFTMPTAALPSLGGGLTMGDNPFLKGVTVAEQSLQRFPQWFYDAAEAAGVLNGQIEQTVTMFTKSQQAASFLGITGQDAAEAFQNSWVSAMTNIEGGLGATFRRIPQQFAESLNAMAQQWLSSQMSSILGKLLGWGLNAIGGAFFGGIGKGPAGANMQAGLGSSGFMNFNPSSMPMPRFAKGGWGSGLAIVGEEGREVVDLGPRAYVYNNKETEKMLAAPKQAITHNHYNFNLNMGSNVRRSYAPKKTAKQIARALLSGLPK